MQRNLGLFFTSNFIPLVYRLEECSPIGDIAPSHEHMCGTWSDAVSWLTRAVAVLLAAGMRDGQILHSQHELVYEGERADRPLHYRSESSTGEHSLTCCCVCVLCCLPTAAPPLSSTAVPSEEDEPQQ
jgi:hypothetical protein